MTRVLVVDASSPATAPVEDAAAVLRAGGLVAFPTETVYGLGAVALREDAVGKVFRAKGRPPTDPLIVHVPDARDARRVAAAWPDAAAALAERFWPGPLTLVVPRHGDVPASVAAGGPTVGVRVPAHPVALALLRAVGEPVAAPSANRFGRVSPTTAGHVLDELDGRIDVVVDGGPTPLGIESTVVAVADGAVQVLRPGGVTVEDLSEVVGDVRVADRRVVAPDGAAQAPGQLLQHYSPATPLVLAEGGEALVAGLVEGLAGEGVAAAPVDLPVEPSGAAPVLYDRLRAADRDGADLLVVRVVDPAGLGRAVNDRLFRAAHGRVVADAAPATLGRLVALVRRPGGRPVADG